MVHLPKGQRQNKQRALLPSQPTAPARGGSAVIWPIPFASSLPLEYNLNCSGWVLARLTNVFLYSLTDFAHDRNEKRCVLPRKLFDRFSVLHIITQLLFAIFFVLFDWGGEYIEVVNCIIIMYLALSFFS